MQILENGLEFGDLKIMEFIGISNKKKIYKCLCKCGKYRNVRQTNLVNNITVSCGCKNFIYKKHKNQKFDPKEASFRAKAANYKANSKKRKIEFLLTIEEVCNLLKGNCFYCGIPPSNLYNVRKRNRSNKNNKIQYAVNNSEEHEIYYNGIDRVDNNKGYSMENCVSCCSRCNTAKLNNTLQDFKDWIIQVYKNIQNNNL